MRIGELSRRTGIPARMLRYYEEQGLITPQRHDNGYRDYNEALVSRVDKIRCYLDAGVPSRIVGTVLECFEQQKETTSADSKAELRALLLHERERMTERIETLHATRASLSALIEFMATRS